MTDRRTFLLSSAAALSAFALPQTSFGERIGGEVFTPASVGAYIQGLLNQTTFEKLVGSLFLAFLENDKTAYMRLVSVKDLNSPSISATAPVLQGGTAMTAIVRGTSAPAAPAPSAHQVVSFYLRFSAGGVVVDQGSYLIDHGTLGRFALFLVPGVDENAQPVCGATFSSLSSASMNAPSAPVAPVRMRF